MTRFSSIPNLMEVLTAEIRDMNIQHGWYDKERSLGDDIALLHTEVSEMYEAYRRCGIDGHVTGGEGKPDDFGSEAADVLIRLLDTCDRYNVDILAEYRRKMTYNRTRPYRHGNKRT